MTSPITTHVLDLQKGMPAAGVPVTLFLVHGDHTEKIGLGITNSDGRIQDLLPAGPLPPGTYQLSFDTKTYFQAVGRQDALYPVVRIDFETDSSRPHYHMPLLLSPFGYSTYRGS